MYSAKNMKIGIVEANGKYSLEKDYLDYIEMEEV